MIKQFSIELREFFCLFVQVLSSVGQVLVMHLWVVFLEDFPVHFIFNQHEVDISWLSEFFSALVSNEVVVVVGVKDHEWIGVPVSFIDVVSNEISGEPKFVLLFLIQVKINDIELMPFLFG